MLYLTSWGSTEDFCELHIQKKNNNRITANEGISEE